MFSLRFDKSCPTQHQMYMLWCRAVQQEYIPLPSVPPSIN